MALIQDEADAAVQGTKKEIIARKRSVINMWIIIGTISTLVTYQSIYSLTYYFFSNEEFCFIVSNYKIEAVSTFAARSSQFVLWYYPIFWLFWPGSSSLCKRQAKAQNRQVSRQMSQEQRGEMSEDDWSEADTKSNTSFVNLNQNSTGSAMFIGAACNANMEQGLVFAPNLARFSNRQSAASEFAMVKQPSVNMSNCMDTRVSGKMMLGSTTTNYFEDQDDRSSINRYSRPMMASQKMDFPSKSSDSDND